MIVYGWFANQNVWERKSKMPRTKEINKSITFHPQLFFSYILVDQKKKKKWLW